MDDAIKLMMQEHIRKGVSEYGIEGTEDKINDLYKCNPMARDKMLAELHQMYNFGEPQ